MASGQTTGGRQYLAAPATRLGRWCIGSFVLGLVGFVGLVLSIASGQKGGDTLADNWWLGGPASVAALGIVGAFVTGLVAVTRMHERAPTVLVVTAIAALATLFLLGEVIAPH